MEEAYTPIILAIIRKVCIPEMAFSNMDNVADEHCIKQTAPTKTNQMRLNLPHVEQRPSAAAAFTETYLLCQRWLELGFCQG